jgi:tagatose 1,6-diphosphate aldolase
MPEPDGSGPAVEEVGRAYREIDALLDRPCDALSERRDGAFRRICAFEPGASGYLAGRALWWQALQYFPDLDAFRRELRRESSPYIEALVSGCTAPARPRPFPTACVSPQGRAGVLSGVRT